MTNEKQLNAVQTLCWKYYFLLFSNLEQTNQIGTSSLCRFYHT